MEILAMTLLRFKNWILESAIPINNASSGAIAAIGAPDNDPKGFPPAKRSVVMRRKSRKKHDDRRNPKGHKSPVS